MFNLLLIALGGAAGTLARYGTATALRGLTERAGFPVGTLAVNLLGCFLIGLLWICTFYVISNDVSVLPIFDDLGQKNLFVGIGFMAVGFAFATRWE